MNRRTHLTALGLTAALLTAAAVSAYGDSDHAPTASTTPPATQPPHHRAGHGSDPDAVLFAAATAIYSWRPSHDPDPGAGFARAAAAGLLAADYVRQVGPTASGLASVTAATWQRWRDADAAVTATAQIAGDDHPADTATSHRRVVIVTQHVLAPTPQPDLANVAYMTASRASPFSPWQVATVEPR